MENYKGKCLVVFDLSRWSRDVSVEGLYHCVSEQLELETLRPKSKKVGRQASACTGCGRMLKNLWGGYCRSCLKSKSKKVIQ